MARTKSNEITEVYKILQRMDDRFVEEGYAGWRRYLVKRSEDIKRIRYLLDVELGTKERGRWTKPQN